MSIEPGSEYILNVIFPKVEDREALQKGGHYLCIAKQIGDTHNMVWFSGDKYEGRDHQCRWTEEYQVHVVDDFKDVGIVVKHTSDAQEIKFGQTCTLDENMKISEATGNVDDSGKFYIDNKYGKTSVSVNSKLFGMFLPIYVRPVEKGLVTFEVKTIVHVWLSFKQTTGMTYNETECPTLEIEYTGGNREHTITYEDGKWSKN